MNVSDMFVVGLGGCLISYLIGRMKNNETKITNNRRFILILSILSVLIILLSLFPFFINLTRVIFISVLTRNFIVFVRYVKKFKRALFQAAIERLAQYGSNVREMRQYKYFSYSMNCICIGFFLILTNLYIVAIICFIVCGLFFGNCYFPFYFFSEYEAVLSINDQDVTNIVRILEYISIIGGLIGMYGRSLLAVPIVIYHYCYLG